MDACICSFTGDRVQQICWHRWLPVFEGDKVFVIWEWEWLEDHSDQESNQSEHDQETDDLDARDNNDNDEEDYGALWKVAWIDPVLWTAKVTLLSAPIATYILELVFVVFFCLALYWSLALVPHKSGCAKKCGSKKANLGPSSSETRMSPFSNQITPDDYRHIKHTNSLNHISLKPLLV